MQKYGDYKVSTYTGVPDITMPIYTMRFNDLAVPISISYHGGGIRVDEESSRVGLGWTLNAGGTISRNILGLDDLNPYALAPNSFDLVGFPVYSVVNQLSIDFATHAYDISGKVGIDVDPALPHIGLDLEPDEFYSNFLGISNKFILQKGDTSAIFEDPSMNMKVKFNITPYPNNDGTPAGAAGVNCTIQVTGNDGTIYSFNQFETCKTTSPTSNIPTRITAWYLTKIQTIKGTVVNFNYTQSVNFQTYSLNHLSVSKKLLSGDQPVTSYVPHSTYWTLFLSSITSPNCNVYFNYDTRLDLNGDKRLTSIQVKDGNSTLIKTVNLVQDYFTANSSTANTYDVQSALWGGPALDTNWLYKRLKLVQLNEVSADSQTTLSHIFEYNETLLPLKNTTSRDHWGFFNNAPNGQNLLPNLSWAYPGLTYTAAGAVYNCTSQTNDFGDQNIQYIESPHKSYTHWTGVNREVDTNYTKAFALNKIIYPTGGYTKFDFEQNTFDRKKSYASDFAAPYYNYISKSDSVGLIIGIPGIPEGYTQSFNFTVTAADTLPGEGGMALMDFQLYGLHQGGNTSNSTTLTTISLINSSNTTLAVMLFNSYTGLISNGDGSFSPSPWRDLRLPIGNYTVKFTFGANVVDKNSPYYALIASWNKWGDNITDGIMYKYSGGVRIRNISNYTSSGILATSLDYIYHFSADSNNNGIPEIYSTGKLMDRPHYLEGNLQSAPFSVSITSDGNCSSQIGYDSVIVQQDKIRHLEAYNNTCYRTNLYNTHIYSNIQMMPVGFAPLAPRPMPGLGLPNDLLNQDIFFDYLPQGVKNFQDNANGKMTKSVDYLYDSVTGKYKVIKLTQNTYTYTGTGIQGIFWADRMLASSNEQFYLCLKGLPPIYGITNYFYPALRSVAVLPAMTIEKTYTATDSLSDTTTYAYNSKNQLKLKTNVNSKGESLIESYSYPLDFPNVTAGTPLSNTIISMKNSNVVAPVIERFVQKKSSSGTLIGTIQASITSYKPANKLPDTVWAAEFAQPSTVFSPLNTSATTITKDVSYKPQLIFSKYDTAGNISAQQRYRDINNVYLWNYSNAYPVCQVTNADSADIAYTSFEADNSGNWTIGSGSLVNSGGLTGSKYYTLSTSATFSKGGLNASRKYIVTYWSKSGSLTVNGTTVAPSYTRNGWTLYMHKLTAGTTSVSISGSGIPIDEVRLLPIDAQMTTYTYSPLVGMTSQCDASSKITYYEYDGLQRLLRIRDMDGNIVKQFDYQYQAATGCGTNCSILPMTTQAGTNTISYPVGVFNVNGRLLGNAANQTQFLNLWNADTANQHRGTLAAGADPLHFNFTVIPGKTVPSISGYRYYQIDIAWNQIDAIRNCNGDYVDFGDGTGMRLGANGPDSATALAPNTIQTQGDHPEWNAYNWYFVHTYPDTSVKTLTFYHSDQSTKLSGLDNINFPATSLTHVRNLRGNLPQYTWDISGSCYQNATALTIAGITNWSSIHSIKQWAHGSGDAGITPNLNMGYPQDFMAGNKDLETINSAGGATLGYFDSTFKISRLKSDWNTYFTHLKSLTISDAHWSREDLSFLKELNNVSICPARQQYSNSSAQIPIPVAVIDNIFIQIAAGAGQTVTNGTLNLYYTGGTTRTSTSDSAVTSLLAKGWTLYLNGTQLH